MSIYISISLKFLNIVFLKVNIISSIVIFYYTKNIKKLDISNFKFLKA